MAEKTPSKTPALDAPRAGDAVGLLGTDPGSPLRLGLWVQSWLKGDIYE